MWWGGRLKRWIRTEYRELFEMMKMFCILIVVVATHAYIFSNGNLNVHLTWVHLIAYKLFLNKVD